LILIEIKAKSAFLPAARYCLQSPTTAKQQ